MKKYIYPVFATIFLSVNAQNIETKLIDITKSYSPQINIVDKEREQIPRLDTLSTTSKPIEYSFFSMPVASTFVPEKGKALRLSLPQKNTYNNSYLAFGAGNYTTLWGNAWVYLPYKDNQYFSVEGEHLSSQGGISTASGLDAFSKTLMGGNYTYNGNYKFSSSVKISHRLFHWYGQNSIGVQNETFKPTHHFYQAEAFANLKTKGIVKNINLQTGFITDNFNSSEIKASIQPEFIFNLDSDYRIGINTQAQIVKSYFKDFNSILNKRSIIQSELLINPSFDFKTQLVYGKIGGKLSFTPSDKTSFNLYPDIQFDVPLMDRFAVLFTGISGENLINSYQNASNVNPFIRPNIELFSTKNPYTGFVGVHGIFDTSIYYHTKFSFGSIHQQMFFNGSNEIINLPFSLDFPLYKSFKTIYDNSSFWKIEGSIEGNLTEEIYFNVQAKYQHYRTETLEKPLYTPNITSSLKVDYKIIPEWIIGADLFFTGEQYALIQPKTLQRIKPFFDLNFNTLYTFNKKWSVIAKLNNVFNKEYQQWLGYPVQGFQVNIGVQYQFKN